MSETSTVRCREWRAAPLEILVHPGLSPESKVLLTWLFMHGNNWKFKIGYSLNAIGISESIWKRRVRGEIMAAGFFVQSKSRHVVEEDGKKKEVILWNNIFTDTPIPPQQN